MAEVKLLPSERRALLSVDMGGAIEGLGVKAEVLSMFASLPQHGPIVVPDESHKYLLVSALWMAVGWVEADDQLVKRGAAAKSCCDDPTLRGDSIRAVIDRVLTLEFPQ